MKQILICAAAIMLTQAAFAQKDTIGLNIPVKDGLVVYENITNVPGKSKAELYKNAKQWLVDYFSRSKDVIQTEDKDEGRIVGKGILIVPFKGALGTMVMYDDKLSIQIDCKDNKCRIRLYEQVLSSPGGDYGKVITSPENLLLKLLGADRSPFNDKQARRMLQSMDTTIIAAIVSFNNAMVAKTDNF